MPTDRVTLVHDKLKNEKGEPAETTQPRRSAEVLIRKGGWALKGDPASQPAAENDTPAPPDPTADPAAVISPDPGTTSTTGRTRPTPAPREQ